MLDNPWIFSAAVIFVCLALVGLYEIICGLFKYLAGERDDD